MHFGIFLKILVWAIELLGGSSFQCLKEEEVGATRFVFAVSQLSLRSVVEQYG
jgi:hypothetical protein